MALKLIDSHPTYDNKLDGKENNPIWMHLKYYLLWHKLFLRWKISKIFF